MDELTIALDVEGVLSNTHIATARRSDLLEIDNTPPDDWDFKSEKHFDEFMHVSQDLWHNHNEEIPSLEPNIGAASIQLNEHHTVDIVTHRTNVADQIQTWLVSHGINYRDFHETSRYKTAVGEYDVHIDDSPNVVNDVTTNDRFIFLVGHEYNWGVEHQDNVWRVSGVTEAAELLSDPTVVEMVQSS